MAPPQAGVLPLAPLNMGLWPVSDTGCGGMVPWRLLTAPLACWELPLSENLARSPYPPWQCLVLATHLLKRLSLVFFSRHLTVRIDEPEPWADTL